MVALVDFSNHDFINFFFQPILVTSEIFFYHLNSYKYIRYIIISVHVFIKIFLYFFIIYLFITVSLSLQYVYILYIFFC